VFEKRVLRRIFEQKRDKVTGGWRKLHKEELHKQYLKKKKEKRRRRRKRRWRMRR
jgi:hypothetical protein